MKSRYFYVIFISIIIIIEALLRSGYVNVNDEISDNRCIRLHKKNTSLVSDFSGLYGFKKIVKFNTNDKREIISGNNIINNAANFYFFGGSTTASYEVNQGKRFPDMIVNATTHNYGHGGIHMDTSYANMTYLNDNKIILPNSTLVVMHGINDLNHIIYNIKNKTDSFECVDKSLHKMARRPIKSFILENVYIVSFINKIANDVRDYFNNNYDPLNPDDVFNAIKMHKINESGDELYLIESEYADLYERILPHLDNRVDVLQNIYNFSVKNNHRLIFLTQPNAYDSKYIIKNNVFMYSTYRGKRITIESHSELLSLLNDQVLNFCLEKGLKCVDINSEFSKYDINKIFLDEVHYSEYGSKKIAEIINSKIE